MKHADPMEGHGVRDDDKNWDVCDRLGSAMELRVSVRSLVQQLVHEQAKASVHLEGLQRDVTTLLDFRESVMDDSPAHRSTPCPSPRPNLPHCSPAVPVPVSSPAPRQADPVTSSDPGDTASSGTSGLGTSTGASGVTLETAGSGGAAWRPGVNPRPDITGSSRIGSTGRPAGPSHEDDELLQLLETIETHGRRLRRQNRRLAAASDDARLSDAARLPDAGQREQRTGAVAGTGARPRCRHCDPSVRHGRAHPFPASDPNVEPGLTPRLDPGQNPTPDPGRRVTRRVFDARNPDVHLAPALDGSAGLPDPPPPPLLPGQSAFLAAWPPNWDRLHLHEGAAAAAPLSLPTMGRRQERLSALTLSERLLQERDRLLEQLAGLEQVAVRSQLHAASLQTRLYRVLGINDALDHELRLAYGHDVTCAAADPRSRGRLTSPAAGRMARSTPDLRPPSRIPQPLSLRRHAVRTPARSRPEVKGSRSSAATVTREARTGDHGSEPDAAVADTPRVGDQDAAAGQSFMRAGAAVSTTGTSTTSVGVSTASLDPPTAASKTDAQCQATQDGSADPVSAARPPASWSAAAAARPPARQRVVAVLRETSPLKLQKELLTLLVEAEALRAEVDSLGRRWTARTSAAGSQAEQSISQADNDELRLQLEVRNIELEGTRARLRQLEAACATKCEPSSCQIRGYFVTSRRHGPVLA
ncbi:uncharacterized protein LOC119104202 [Pollicipes pollicipes]|uniref:uncharacterized protein LOC119104202 n=1 Tax=Pollicipes pollicipes TaxID=41117 RepID=UPI001884BCF0|nr:uncharacterized protein LOC119104202 [Pollicipes pollicipes]